MPSPNRCSPAAFFFFWLPGAISAAVPAGHHTPRGRCSRSSWRTSKGSVDSVAAHMAWRPAASDGPLRRTCDRCSESGKGYGLR